MIGRVLAILSLLFNYRLVCRLISVEEVSVYVITLGIVSLGVIICCSGLGSVLLRHIASAEPVGDDNERRLFVGVATLATLSWLVVTVGLYLLLSFNPEVFGRPILPLFELVVIWIAVRCFLNLVTEAIRGRQIFWLASLSGGQQEGPLVNLSVMVMLLWIGPKLGGVQDVVCVHVTATLMVSVFTMIAARMAATSRVSSGPEKTQRAIAVVDTTGDNRLTGLLSESVVVLISQLSILGIVEFETLMIGRFCNDDQVGAWGAIRRILTVVSAPLLFINAAIPGFISELHARGDKAKLERLLRATATLATPPALIAFLVLLFVGEEILAIFDPTFATAWLPLVVLAAANIVFVGAGSAGLALRMTGNQRRTTLSTLLIAGTYVILAPVVIAHHGLVGAALLGALVIVSRNVISTAIVRHYVGVWCVPSMRPSELIALVRELSGRLKSKKRPQSSSP